MLGTYVTAYVGCSIPAPVCTCMYKYPNLQLRVSLTSNLGGTVFGRNVHALVPEYAGISSFIFWPTGKRKLMM